jgi:adenylate cyclase
MSQTRRLAAILAADLAGYSRLIGADESGTLQGFRAIRTELFDPTIAAHNGRLVKTPGEACSLVDALRCAAAVQREMTERNAEVAPDRRIDPDWEQRPRCLGRGGGYFPAMARVGAGTRREL